MEDDGGWARTKVAIGQVVGALSALFATRWSMASIELRAFGARLALALILLAAACGLVAAGALAAGAAVIVALHALVGGWLVAVLLAVAICLAAAAGLVAVAISRLRRGGRLLAGTAREIGRDIDELMGPRA